MKGKNKNIEATEDKPKSLIEEKWWIIPILVYFFVGMPFLLMYFLLISYTDVLIRFYQGSMVFSIPLLTYFIALVAIGIKLSDKRSLSQQRIFTTIFAFFMGFIGFFILYFALACGHMGCSQLKNLSTYWGLFVGTVFVTTISVFITILCIVAIEKFKTNRKAILIVLFALCILIGVLIIGMSSVSYYVNPPPTSTLHPPPDTLAFVPPGAEQ